MTAVLSGTNGLLQAYDYQAPATGFSYTFAAGTQVLVMNPAGTLATGTITMPASPSDGMTITFSSSQQITALTLNGNTGQSIVGAVTFLPAKTGVTYVYRSTGTTWYPTATVPGTGSQLVSGTSQASTSGTSIDFTGIPSWVKRITVMFNGVSTSGTSNLVVRVGNGSFVSTGYTSAATYFVAAGVSTQADTSGFLIRVDNASNTISGALTMYNVTGNTWVYSLAAGSYATTQTYLGGGSIALGGTLDRMRITATNGTDTFDAGSINILYE